MGDIYNKSAVARRYFELRGEDLTKQEAANRWRMLRKIDFDTYKRVLDEGYKEAISAAKKAAKD